MSEVRYYLTRKWDADSSRIESRDESGTVINVYTAYWRDPYYWICYPERGAYQKVKAFKIKVKNCLVKNELND